MKELTEISVFMERVQYDPRIGPLHISLYMAIIFCWARQGRPDRVLVMAKELKPLAKIVGGATFFRCIRQLHRYGYIVYEPSYNPAVKSRIFLSAQENERNVKG
jgi:hypothetical protein